MERGFEYLVGAHGDGGARDIFERICINLFQSIYGPATKSVKVSQGDGGIDVLVGELPKPQKVYQCKFFLNGIGPSQRQQITDAFKRVTSKYEITEWRLCLPCILTQQELLWWSKWKNEQSEDTGIRIELCDGSYLIHQLKLHDIYEREFDEDIRIQLERILTELRQQKQEVFDEVIYDEIDGIEGEYNDFIFVKMLESAGIFDINEYKIDFFNAEISRQESISKDEVEGLRIYNNLKIKILSVWKTQFKLYESLDNGKRLLLNTYLRIEDLDSTTLQSTPEYNLLSKKGILHQLANDKKIGWITNYLEKLSEYVGENI